jgi:hypothetical protein
MTIKFDPEVIKKSAQLLYRKADTIIAIYGLIGAIAGATVTALLIKTASPVIFIGIGIGVLFGIFAGKEKALKYKLEAQLALCQLQIAINTRTQKQ